MLNFKIATNRIITAFAPFKRMKRKRGAETKAGGVCVCAFVLLPKVSNHVGKLNEGESSSSVPKVLKFSGTPASVT